MAKKYSRSRRMRGGATPYYSFGSAVAPGAPYAAEVQVHDSPNVVRPGTLSSAGNGTGGLPGFTGGGKRGLFNVRRYLNYGRKAVRGVTRYAKRAANYGRKTTRKVLGRFYGGRRNQQGGRYTLDVASAVGGPNVFVPVSRIGCEGGMVNTAPPGALPNPTPMRGGAGCKSRRCWTRRGYKNRRQAGGKRGNRRQSGGVGGIDSAAYYAPTAGYGNQPSTWVSSTGTPSMLQIPYDARAANPACLKTA